MSSQILTELPGFLERYGRLAMATVVSAVGSTPRDIIAVLQNLRSAGALEAEIEVI